MAGTNTTELGITRDQVVLGIVAVVAGLLTVDLLAKLAGLEIWLVVVTLGGNLALANLLSNVWTGVTIGLIFGLAGIGLSMTYSILSFANFSHGDLLTTGAFTGWGVTLLIAGWGVGDAGYLLFVFSGSGPGSREVGASILGSPLAILMGAIVAGVVTIAVALLLDRLVYRPMRDRGGIPLLIASIGAALALRYTIQFIYGSSSRGVTDTSVTEESYELIGGIPLQFQYDILGVNVNLHQITLVTIALALMIGMHLLLQQTKLGKAMRAMADNKDLALVTGIPTERVVRATWALGAGLAGVAGFLFVLERGTIDFNLGWFLLLFIFSAVILGGIGSIYGAIAGGLVIGLVRELSLIWIPSDFNTAAAFTIMILVLLYRPEGIFSGVTTA